MDPSRAIQHEISSLKGAGRGWGPSRGVRTSCDLWLGAAHRRAAVRVCRPGDSFGRGELEPQKPQAHASPGYHASPGLTGCMCVWGDSSRSPAASVRGGGAGCSGGGGAEVGAGRSSRSAPSPLRDSAEPLPRLPPCRQEVRVWGWTVGISVGRRQTGWPRASPHCGSLFWGGGVGGCPRSPVGCPGNLEGPGVGG